MLKHPIYYAGQPGNNNSGWGVCNQYLLDELSRMERVVLLPKDSPLWRDGNLAGYVFTPLADNHLEPITLARGLQNYGYVFFDLELSAQARENARKLTTVFAGSTWCMDRLREAGIENTALLIQGIDSRIFYLQEEIPIHDPFVIFSGGKFELRKGQDLVLSAFRAMQERHDDVLLVNAWTNQWTESLHTMNASRHIRVEWKNAPWEDQIRHLCALNGIDPRRLVTLPLLAQQNMADIYRQSDVGLFPNRCEGGTNLVLMEYMACGKPVIASCSSGHRDIVTAQNALLLQNMRPFAVTDGRGRLLARWEEADLDEIIERLEYAYSHRKEIQALGRRASEDLKRFSWQSAAATIVKTMAARSESSL